jgi:hypothetical protein
MSDFEKEVPLAMAKQWELTDALKNPIADSKKGFKQPDRVEVRRSADVVGQRDQLAKVVPDQALQGIEWPIVHTIPQFQSNIIEGWKLTIPGANQAEIFKYFLHVLQGNATSLWKAVLREHAMDPATHTLVHWTTCVRYYLEKMAGMKYIGDYIIHQVLTWKRPIVVSFNDCVDRSTLLLSYMQEGQLRTEEPMPNNRQLMNAYYRN